MPGMLQPQRQINIDPATGQVQVFAVKSLFTSKWNKMDLPTITSEQWDLWQTGRRLIQDAMPDLSMAQREFLLTGATPEEWDAEFGDDDE